ncbi:bleomycin hydrolase [Petromyzon marinus]|uniref:Bleomycin hydrolase n=1 Tax=Petromyzon marinus TaxID=7757 RepID=A0AAJ7UKQ9_PETMA|nr:bleomycin hydrolase [Petromyzon marinus]XP_032836508.1 bleomycin hydrolase [Petromyzon marinus]
MAKALTREQVERYEKGIQEEPRYRLARNFVSAHDPLEVCADASVLRSACHVYAHCIPAEGKPTSNQKNSGRCWIFACLNVMRLPFIKKFNIEDFEFSQTYLFFWDKVERCHYLLRALVETAQRGEAADGRLLQFLLSNPCNDGGQWHMLVNLIEKYGVMPKKNYPECHTSEASRRMNEILNHKMREYCLRLRKMVDKGSGMEEIDQEIDIMVEEVYRVVSICLGCPPSSFTWDYKDKEKAFHSLGPLTPLQFYQQHVKPLYDVATKVCLVNDPRPHNEYGRLYTVEFLGNVVGGHPTLYVNQPAQLLKSLAAASIRSGEAVWFGCDVGKHFHGKLGIHDMNLYNHELVFGVSIKSMTKSERLIYGDSLMTHAMVLTAYSDVEGKEGAEYEKWRVENSWGDDRGCKGYLSMCDAWFSEFVYEVVVDRSLCPEAVLAVLAQEPHVLPAWDPMGALAS